MGTISVSQLSESFANKNVISDLSFEIPKGRITGLLGPNGAGKTTTLRLLTGSLHPDKGTIQYDGFDFFENKIEIQKKSVIFPNPLLSIGILRFLNIFPFLEKQKEFLKKSKRKNRLCFLAFAIGNGSPKSDRFSF
ncbi:hypothetical protein LEP1GSC127_2515 [Leptospira kirschneri str. 200801925]|nr:hypothetical protein LEP1GSC127_2515 [Leptospira kirschneri str. 200801925]